MNGFRKENNFRELGGYKTKDGRTVKKGMLFRSGTLGNLDEGELELVRKLGLKTVFDFRSKLEKSALPDPEIEGATNINISALQDNDGNDIDYSPVDMVRMALKEPGINKMDSLSRHMYRFIAFDSEAYKMMFDLMLAGKTPMLFHCTQGKDRTGVAAILILIALGVDEETILDDYVLTNQYRKELIEKQMEKHKFLTRVSKNAHTFMWVKEGVERSFGEASIKAIQERYPDYESFFLTEYDLTQEDLDRLRYLYLE